ncbi:MAG: hypothetical protein K2W82_00300 [Candidatus Obscuribacterales bacterium]|nr:hypothetical protein [Candidatus Obscuribacterales bacterium]
MKSEFIIAAAVLLFGLMFSSESAKASPTAKKVSMSNLSAATFAPSQETMIDGKEFFQSMADAAAALESYSLKTEMTVFKGSKVIHENSNFYFKKPRLLRAEELGPHKKGSVAVLQANGKLRGHLGGMLSKFVSDVDPSSSWAVSANDYPLVKSDFYSMSQVMVGFLNSGYKGLVTGHPVKVPGQSAEVYVIELYKTGDNRELIKRAYINPQTLLPVEWFDYKDGKLFAHTFWKNLRLNIDLPASLFKL